MYLLLADSTQGVKLCENCHLWLPGVASSLRPHIFWRRVRTVLHAGLVRPSLLRGWTIRLERWVVHTPNFRQPMHCPEHAAANARPARQYRAGTDFERPQRILESMQHE